MDKKILAAASDYNKNYYLNPEFKILPPDVQNEIRELCVINAAKTKGIFILGFYSDGSLYYETERAENDFFYDEIDARLCVRDLAEQKSDLFEKLTLWYNMSRTSAPKE